MARTKTDERGIKQLAPNLYQVRITKVINGKKKDLLYKIDERTNEPIKTKTQAAEYRQYIINKLKEEAARPPEIKNNITYGELWQLYLDKEAQNKAPQTVIKHKSVWNNHLKTFCSHKKITDLSVGEINAFLSDKYLNTNLSFHYIEGFLKVFYLLIGLAYTYNYIDLDTLTRYTIDKKSRINMPAMTDDDEAEEGKIEIYTPAEIDKIYNIFKGTDLEAAFLLAYMCGLRESEIFALFWSDFDSDKKILKVNKQLLCLNGVFTLTGVKTLAGYRDIELNDFLNNFLIDLRIKHLKQKTNIKYRQRANEIIIDARGKEPREIISGDFINRKLQDGLEGKLLTTNSLKYYAKKVKADTGLQLKMHKLRKTHLSFLANHGYPTKALMKRAGHKRLSTTMKFYITDDDDIKKQQTEILNTITPIDPLIDFEIEDATTGEIFTVKKKKSEIEKILNTYKK